MNHYYTQNPDAPHDISTIIYTVEDLTLKLNTDSGVFSKRRVDFGSDLLIRSIPPVSGNILDIGCGYGVIGISLALLNPSSSVTMIDINERAVDLAMQNIRLNGVKNANVLVSDGFSNVSGKFDAIVSNPPIRTGKKVIYPIFENSINFLNPGGSIYLVIQKKQGASSAINFLNTVYGNCEVINKKAGYWIIKSTKE
ncbi:MAG TPA: class I SAM-dependent methyltransferase [Acetivibrio sp.]|uniref:class I SAM-dependent methyltransferase n=1 Tax=Acetivibrio sp. TaxID=1872092 RepID=UPI002B850938|nr:class I SAM-dependent methyltransferase [Acetivibrio sp.]HOM02974.1 class I SAM-dependent methyltransferase [Acetivibrio sp.]